MLLAKVLIIPWPLVVGGLIVAGVFVWLMSRGSPPGEDR